MKTTIIIGILLLTGACMTQVSAVGYEPPEWNIEINWGNTTEVNETIQNILDFIEMQNNTIDGFVVFLSDLLVNITEYRDNVNTTIEMLNTTISDLNNTINEMNSTIVEMNTTIQILESENANLSENKTLLETTLISKNATIASLKQSLEDSKIANTNLTSRMNDLYFENDDLRSSRNQYQTLYHNHKTGMDQLSNPWAMSYYHPDQGKTLYMNFASIVMILFPSFFVLGLYLYKAKKIDNNYINLFYSKLMPTNRGRLKKKRTSVVDKSIDDYESNIIGNKSIPVPKEEPSFGDTPLGKYQLFMKKAKDKGLTHKQANKLWKLKET